MKRVRNCKGRVLYAGQCYYNAWYLSRELRKMGWCADVLDWDSNEDTKKFYHGADFKFTYGCLLVDLAKQLFFYISALVRYDIFHFSGAHNMSFGPLISGLFKQLEVPAKYGRGWEATSNRLLSSFFNRLGLSAYSEIRLLKKLGKKIVYTNNGCLDGVSQSSFRSWPDPEPVCDICIWRDKPAVCSDERNLAWGAVRNSLADYQCNIGGNRKDYNDDSHVHEVPEFYCLDPDMWRPDLIIPPEHLLSYPPGTVRIYHAVGNYDLRTDPVTRRNIKSTHIYLPLIEQMKREGYPVELIFAKDIQNKEVRFYQAQADIVVDMLTFGFFGANVREAMMLGKTVVCYLRPEWLASMRQEIPDYVDELPVVSATPETIHEVLVDLIEHPKKREEIGRRSRDFAVKWHSAEAGARRMDKIYSDLLKSKVGTA